ncbi:MAG TPA: quinolinate synthase NadA [Nitrospiria bacterium]|nr:quinolinate synthase NadA [Nitrospiria bacterium]HUK55585.1 quinolinate synthase NadA [Nitrospiria bacterium]
MDNAIQLKTPETGLEEYYRLSPDILDERISDVKARLGDRLLLLGHNYQRDEVYKFADYTGDSLKLSQYAAQRKDREYIVFCGVKFMAETADILTTSEQKVILPDLAAGCSMADMADIESVETAWQEITHLVPENTITPITYINSAADLKAFCGERGGLVCTSTNAERIIRWAFERREKILFFPDQHLGRNTCKRMGISLDEMVLWDPLRPNGGNRPEAVRKARVFLWQGFCSVHQMFQPQHVDLFKKQYPGIQVIVHPECSMEVVDKSDLIGSTEYIIRTVTAAPAGSRWAVGTELNLVNRLKRDNPEKEIYFLSPMVCMCSTMFRIDAPHLLWSMERLEGGAIVNQIIVPEADRTWAKVALDRMLELA